MFVHAADWSERNSTGKTDRTLGLVQQTSQIKEDSFRVYKAANLSPVSLKYRRSALGLLKARCGR